MTASIHNAAPNAAETRTESNAGTIAPSQENAPQGVTEANTQDPLAAALFGNSTQQNVENGGTVANYDTMEALAIRRDAGTFRNLIAGMDGKVSEFFNKWRGGRSSQNGDKLEKLYLGRMTDSVRQKASEVLGYNVDKRDFIITNDDVKHIFDHHGNSDAEVSRGNLPLEEWMMDALPEIVANPDSIEPGGIGAGKKNAGKQALLISKTYPGGTVVTVQFDNKGRSTMEINTLYANKNKGTTSKLDTVAETAPNRTSETLEPVPSVNANIAPVSENVKKDRTMERIASGDRIPHRRYHLLSLWTGNPSRRKKFQRLKRWLIGNVLKKGEENADDLSLLIPQRSRHFFRYPLLKSTPIYVKRYQKPELQPSTGILPCRPPNRSAIRG